MQNNYGRGILYAIIAAVLWGLTGLLSQYLFQKTDVTISWSMGVKSILSGLLILAISYNHDGNHIFSIWHQKKDIASLLVYGLIGLAGVQVTYSLTVLTSDAAIATIIQMLGIIGVIIYSTIFFKQRPRRQEYIAIILSLLGTWLLVTRGHLTELALSKTTVIPGICLIFCSAGLSVLPFNLLRKYSSLIILGWGLLIGGVCFEIIHPFWINPPQPTLIKIIAIILITFVGTALAYLLYLHSMNYINSTVASLLDTFEPLTAALGTVFFFNAHYNWAEYVGSFFILSTVFVLAVGSHHQA
ncbi:DMT family transporter [Ligilactobacillus sp. WILCCON 0076]|uniref:DMT family transporter n=1 Tax=Ligilactobacillus ubinensis TaxID=2876789 RepID=A0A9X2FIN3_9LACO|nr:EamA family transporter [Ligilactobacillus ubinensis]MCP0886532.1 DMT family transporter [Ligilactobacillus ubinensis]